MIKQEAISLISKELGVAEEDVKRIVNRFLYEVNCAFLKGETVTFSEFGTFELQHQKPKNIFSPRTKKMFRWLGKKTIKFRLSGKIEDRLNAK